MMTYTYKLLSSKTRKFILSMQHLPLKEQKEKLITHFEEWKKHEEQIDDVCVIGYKI
ncbi:hypothetical protein [Parvicella tangerina]|uniref:Uncharacterized protein n=1 Tax=Parvicella tangerina TaxID=2829795 RepID=A0A916JQI0_9FLAO|nr:hypothetical protein [Parvicella tangerina]CAG5087834.1 hypothetical protein CRYO30217_03593 [Parvicella tangerina]